MGTKPRFKKKVKNSRSKDYHFWSNNRKGPISIPEQHRKFYWGFKSCFKLRSMVFRTLLKPKLLLGLANTHANLLTVGKSLLGHYFHNFSHLSQYLSTTSPKSIIWTISSAVFEKYLSHFTLMKNNATARLVWSFKHLLIFLSWNAN